MSQRLAQLCADDTPAAEIQATLNREFQVNRHRTTYSARARRLGLKWPERNRPFPAQKCYLAGCERAGTGNLHHAAQPRPLDVEGTDGRKTVLIYAMSCGFDNPYRTLHTAHLGPHGEQLTPVLNEKTGKHKPGCWIYTDTKTDERIETESNLARALRNKETAAKMSKAAKRAWKKHRKTRLLKIRAANRNPIRREKIKAKGLERYGDRKAPETWTPEQQKAREDQGKANKAFWDGLTPAERRRQVKRRTAGSHRPEVKEKHRKHKALWWAKRNAELVEARRILAQRTLEESAQPVGRARRGRSKRKDEETSWYRIGKLVEERIPPQHREARWAIVGARQAIAEENPQFEVGVIAEYHKHYRRSTRNKK